MLPTPLEKQVGVGLGLMSCNPVNRVMDQAVIAYGPVKGGYGVYFMLLS